MRNRFRLFVSSAGYWAVFLLLPCLTAASQTTSQQTQDAVEPLLIESTALPKGLLHQSYSYSLKARGGVPPLLWEISGGALPEGVTLGSDGTLGGVPQHRGEFHFAVTVADAAQPAHERSQEFVLEVVAPLLAEWGRSPAVAGQRIEGSVKVSNDTEQDFDLTVIIVGVNGFGRATALGYQRLTLQKGTLALEIPFGENLPRGTYQVHADAVAEVAETNSIYRSRLVSDPLEVQPTP